jgi:hypothetical protein
MNKLVGLAPVYNSQNVIRLAPRHRKWWIYKDKLTIRDANCFKKVITTGYSIQDISWKGMMKSWNS